MSKTISRSNDNVRPIPALYKNNKQKIQQMKYRLDQESHIFIVTLGAIIGSIFSLFIAYQLEPNVFIYALLSLIPFALSYSLRKVYIHTLVHSQD